MKYQSEVLKEIIDKEGHITSLLHYQSECVETFIKDAKGSYPKLCDYEGEWLNYINTQSCIGEFPYVTLSDVTEATVNNVVPYEYKSAILKGNSKVVVGKNKCNMEEIKTGWLDGQTGTVTEDDSVFIPVKVSGTITISNYIHTNVRYVYEYDANGNYLGRTKVTTDIVTLVLNQNTTLIKIGFYRGTLSTVKSLDLQVEQGEIATEYEPYNATIVSVKMPILTTTGKNLIDSEIIAGWLNTSNGEINNLTSTTTCATKDLIKVKPATQYSIYKEYDKRVLYAQFNEKQEFINFGTYTHNRFTTDSNAVYVRLFFETPVNEELKAMLYEGGYNSNISYEPYKSNILSTSEDVVLRGIGEVKDTLDCLTGEVVERIGEIVLDGSEEWNLNNLNSSTNTIIPYLNNYFTKQTKMLMAEFPRYSGDNIWSVNNDYECYLDNTETIAIRINKDKLATTDINGFKQWLSQNPITIQYELVSESVKKVDLSVVNQDGNKLMKIRPIEGTMNISTSSDTIQPTFSGEIPVEAITQNLASFIEE